MASAPARSANPPVSVHEGFLRHRRFRWLKIALVFSLVTILAYAFADVEPRPGGGTWMGYTLGTIGALLMVWLALIGVRKRAITQGNWSLKGWTSAHVYLGLSLLVVVTLHTGFQFGWNIHTLAYALMVLVIASGIFGITVYAVLPSTLSSNREQMTQGQMVDAIRSLDRQINEAALPLDRASSDLVQSALGENPFAPGLFQRLSGVNPKCRTQAALAGLSEVRDLPTERVVRLLERRKAQLDRLRRHMRLKAFLEVWLYVHVPATIALLAALVAHIISVFFYW